MIITVDGLAASGKGTLAKALGNALTLPVLDTGALWRVLAYQLRCANFTPDVSPERLERASHEALDRGLKFDLVENAAIRTEENGQFASVISGFATVRRRVDSVQTDWLAINGQRGILDGRETGTSIAPHADFKFFLFAETMARALRRAGQTSVNDVAAIAASIEQRDKREITRRVSPVRPPFGAVVIDTTYRSIRATIDMALNVVVDRGRWDEAARAAFAL